MSAPARLADAAPMRGGPGAAPAAAVIGLVAGAGLLGAILQSLQPASLVGGPLSTAAWRAVLGDPAFADAVAFTLWTAVASATLALVAGIALAAALRGAGVVGRLVVALPVALPPLVVAVALAAWLGPAGIVERATGLDLGLVGERHGAGMLLVALVKEAPFVALVVAASWDAGTRRREEAAAVLGAGPARRLLLVALPRLLPAAAAAALAVAAFVLGSFEVVLVTGPTAPETLATYALHASRSPDGAAPARAAAALLVAGGLALAAAGLAARLLRSHDA